MKTSELIGPALDWAVIKCEVPGMSDKTIILNVTKGAISPSTNWAQGGPIIEREEIALAPGYNWEATKEIEYRGEADYCVQHGPTPLVAAMRSYVCGNLGDEIEIPEELK